MRSEEVRDKIVKIVQNPKNQTEYLKALELLVEERKATALEEIRNSLSAIAINMPR